MKNLFRRLFGCGPSVPSENRKRKREAAAGRLRFEALEDRMLLNSHPASEVPHHIHPHLSIFVDGENFTIPANVGVSLGVVQPNENAHTHTDDGIIHYNEATPVFRDLDEFFDTWGGLFNQNQLRLPTAYDANGQPTQFTDRLVDATHTIKFFVNGAASSDFEQYEPEDGDQIVISYETIAAATAPTLNPFNNVTMSSNPGSSAPDRAFYVPLDGSDPNNDALTYTAAVSPSGSAITVEVVAPTSATGDNPVLRLSVSGFDIDGQAFSGSLVFELFRDDAPDTVDRIVQLVNQGFYTGLSFHRVVNDFVAQGGDPSGNGSGGSGVDFDDEYNAQITFNGFGQLAMANSGDDTNDSQFFITDSNLSLVNVAPDAGNQTTLPPSHLNFNHTIFGQLISGFDIFNKIMLTPVSGSTPISQVTINSAAIVTDNQHAMLKVTAPHDFVGTATVTVTASDTTSLTAQRSFEVNVVSDTTNDRPFLGTLADVTTVVNTSVNVPLPATDLEGDTLTFVVRDPNSFFSLPANVSVSIDQNSRIATITPTTNFTGTVELLVGVRDQTDRDGDSVLDEQTEFDTQRITLTVSSNSSTISGRKFHDLDGDGVQDVGEAGLQGWDIQLDSGADGSIDAVTTTASDGTYSFTGFAPATYRVREVSQTGWTQTTANPVDIVLDGLSSTSGVDFGNFQRFAIAGRKFNDSDGDGTDDGGADPGLSGWTIQLDTGADGTVDATAITGADGTYQFPDLGPGVYRIREVLQTGSVQTTANPADITGTSGTNVGGVNFGNFDLITISGRKFEDTDGDGTDDGGSDQGLAGWTIQLDTGADGTVDATTTTAVDGTYSFANLGPGTYRVREQLQSGWLQTTTDPADITAASGGDMVGLDFGNFQRITLSGHKFNDLDGDGSAREGGEPGLGGWTVFLDTDDDGQLGGGEPSTTTDADGNYSFSDLEPGVYRVREVLQSQWINTFSIAGVVALSGANLSGVDLGNFQFISISGRKFHDRDNDGTDNGGTETGLADWVIELDIGANGTVDATATTAADGTYSFSDLGPGTYRAREQMQPGWIQSTADPADIVAASSTNVTGVDFGNFLPPAAITGLKFDDSNGNGVQDSGEPGLAGWTIELDQGADGTVDFTTTTDAGGLYAFTGLDAGTYRVRELNQSGWVQTTAAPADLVLADGETELGVDFGNFQLITIGGRKFDDTDGNGTDDGTSDPGLSGWTITLDIGADGTVDATASTAADGTYSFADLGPGTYRVREQLQAGWRQTTVNSPDVVATSGADASNVDFGNFKLISISGRKFEDTDGDGTDDGGTDPGLADWTIKLDIGADGTVDATATTAADGTYSFPDLGPGTYRVREQQQAGWQQTTAEPSDTVAISGTDAAADFGNFQLITISGRKFEDSDGDGTDDGASDPGLPSWTIFLDENLNETLDDGEPSVLSAADGTYEFADLGPGTYRVREVLQAGWTQTTTNSPDIFAASGADIGSIDFGNFHLPTLSGIKREDLLGDGFTADDTALAGWTIELFRDDGDGQFDPSLDTLTDGVVTDAGGRYEFLNVATGTYFVREILQDGWIQTAGAAFYTVNVAGAVSGETFTGNDFGNFRTISITGFKINDGNGNGVLDGTDASQAGWTIFLDDNDNGVLDDGERSTTTADGSGQYTFTDVGPGDVRVREVLQTGWIQIIGDRDFVAESGQDVSDVNFLNFQLITISGVKFNDQNGNATLDEGETPLAGWTIFLDDNDNGVLDDGERSAITADGDGSYSFTDLGPGTYRVREVLQTGWVQVTANPVIDATSGTDNSAVNFGNFELITLSGQKFHDRNGNATKDADEVGVAGVVIFIDSDGDAVLDTGEPQTMTLDDGTYSLTDVGPGTHQLREVTPAGRTQTLAPAAVQATGGVDVSGLDFGNFVNTTISGAKFNDLDGDGTRDSGEPGLAGWTIFIDTNGSGTLDSGEISATTGSDGQYVLSDVGPGTHRVREVLQSGWQQTTAAPADIVAVSEQIVTGVDFGNFQLITISGQKFEDRDGDGVKETGESGLSGWTIFLDSNANDVLDTGETSTVTGSDGTYSFANLGPGEYRVREVLQTGWTRTLPSMSSSVVHVAESGRNLSDVDFGNFRLVTISGQKFLDINADGFFDFDELGLPGWTIFLDANDNGSLDADELSAVTDEDGSYSISDVGPGTYRLAEVLMDGFRQTTELASFTVTSGTDLTGQDIGNLPELTAQIIQDPLDPEKTALLVGGSSDDDQLTVTCGKRGRHMAQINGQESGPFEPTGHIIVLGFEGDDRIALARCVNLPGQLDGGEGNDTMRGGHGDDEFLGGDGDDVMNGRAGDDVMEGGEGNEQMRGGRGNDDMAGDEGDDMMKAGRGDDFMDGGDDDDQMSGGLGDDDILGGFGNDRIRGRRGSDTIDGEDGDDVLRGGRGSDDVFGSDGDDHIRAARGHDTIDGGDGADTVNCVGNHRADVTSDADDVVKHCGANNTGQDGQDNQDEPVAVNDSFSVNEDTTLSGTSVLDNDTVDDDLFPTAELVSGPVNAASFSLNFDGTFTYTPAANFNGTDSFTYEVVDDLGFSNTATVSITVNSINDAPVPTNDSFTVVENSSLSGTSVLNNDSDSQNGAASENNLPLTAQLVTSPTQSSSFTLNTDGTFTYTPLTNFRGTDTFTYSVTDSLGGLSITATVTLLVGVVAVADSYNVIEDTTLSGTSVLSNDTDGGGPPLTAQVVTQPSQAAFFSLNSDGTFTYTPAANFSGTDTFTYQAVNSFSIVSNVATVTISVSSVNDAPAALSDSFNMSEDGSLSASVAGSVSDNENNLPLTFQLVSGPFQSQSFSLGTDGSFSYTPNANFNGTDSFTYQAFDSLGAVSNTATTTIFISSVNDAPDATGDSFSVDAGGTLNGTSVLDNDSDSHSGAASESNVPLTAQLVVGPANAASFTLNSDGTFIYTPADGFDGLDSFTYQAADSLAATSIVTTVTITVNPTN